jgi:hypothetical protein
MNAMDNLNGVFARIEAAIDAHPKLKRLDSIVGEPEVVLSRFGATVRIRVKLNGSRRSVCPIHADGDSIESAADNLVRGLDVWAEVI